MPWSRNEPEPDPLEVMKRKLAEQERILSEQRARLMEELHGPDDPSRNKKPVEPPVWRLEDDGLHHHRAAEPTPARKRGLARQRQRDMILAIVLLVLFLLVLIIGIWIAYVHNTAAAAGV